jgi:hypothetical protein
MWGGNRHVGAPGAVERHEKVERPAADDDIDGSSIPEVACMEKEALEKQSGDVDCLPR